MIAVFEERKERADYLVGWVDAFTAGGKRGRGLVHQAIHLGPGEDPEPAHTLHASQQELPAALFGVLPKAALWRLMRPLVNHSGVRLVNALKHHSNRITPGRPYRHSHTAFALPLCYVPDLTPAY